MIVRLNFLQVTEQNQNKSGSDLRVMCTLQILESMALPRIPVQHWPDPSASLQGLTPYDTPEFPEQVHFQSTHLLQSSL